MRDGEDTDLQVKIFLRFIKTRIILGNRQEAWRRCNVQVGKVV